VRFDALVFAEANSRIYASKLPANLLFSGLLQGFEKRRKMRANTLVAQFCGPLHSALRHRLP
jgi:hypothetical protein